MDVCHIACHIVLFHKAKSFNEKINDLNLSLILNKCIFFKLNGVKSYGYLSGLAMLYKEMKKVFTPLSLVQIHGRDGEILQI